MIEIGINVFVSGFSKDLFMNTPLNDITVLDLTRVLAGPYASMWLADLGAEIIKVERPDTGDDTRSYGPPFVNGESSYFMSVNRNKKSVTLNFKTEEGQEILWNLIDQSDVLLENFRPGTLDRAGFGYEDVKERHPEMIYTSISGFGQTGPFKDEPGFDLSIQGMSGLMSLTGSNDGPPTKFGTSISDLVSGIYGAMGTITALYHRQRTGEGQHVDVGMMDSMVSLLTYQAGRYFATGKVPERMGNFHPSLSPYETFETKDGYINLALGNDSLFERFCTLIDREELLDEEEFSTNPNRVQNQEYVHETIEEEMKKKTTDEWLETLSEAGLPAGPIQDVEEVFEHPQIDARDMLEQVEHPETGEISVTGIPIKMDKTPGEVEDPPPTLGEHTDQVLQNKLNYSQETIDRLREEGTI